MHAGSLLPSTPRNCMYKQALLPLPVSIPSYTATVHVGEGTVRVPDLKLRFHAAGTMHQPRPEVGVTRAQHPLPASAFTAP